MKQIKVVEKKMPGNQCFQKRCQANSAYSYDAAGRLTGINYSDATPDVSYTLDRAGRAVSVTDGGGTREQEWTGPGGALARVEHAVGGLLGGLAVDIGHDTCGRRETLSVSVPGTSLSSTSYGYAAEGAVPRSVAHGGATATYDYTLPQVAGLPAAIAYTRKRCQANSACKARLPRRHPNKMPRKKEMPGN